MKLQRLSMPAFVLAVLLLIVSVIHAQTVHVVQPGDSLFRIALQYGVTVDAIIQANNIVNPNLIIVGQELIIPTGDGTTTVPATPQPAATPPPAAGGGAGGNTTTTGGTTHIVQPGDSLFRISLTYGVPVAQIVAANNITNPSLIYVGQELVIPGAGGTTTTAPPAGGTVVQPTAVAPAPTTAPASPPTGGNLFPNPSFEGNWYFYLYNELQVPEGWQVATDEGPVTVTDDPGDVYFRPEIRVVSTAALPESEHSQFIFDGVKTVKAFKGGAPTSFSMFTDVPLQPGQYRMTINLFPDIVAQYYPGGRRDYSTHPLAAEYRFINNNGGTDWGTLTPGQKNTRTYEFTVTEPGTTRLGASFRSRFVAANNGYFLDNWSLERIGN
jgi:LysM repeat protein